SITATGAFADANAGTGKTVNLSGLTLGGESAGNYILAATGNQSTATADITAVNVTLDWESETSYTYNGADQSGTVKAYYTDINGAKVYVSVNFGDGVTFKNAGDYTASAEGSAADSNYAYAASTKSLTIDKAVVTVNGITAANKIYDGSTTATLNFSGATFGGIVDGDTLTVTATGAFADANAGTGKTVNLSDLTLGGESLGNYILATTGNQTTANADIAARAISIVVDNVSMFEGKTEPALTYELTNGMLVNGDTIELSRVAGTSAGSYAINGYKILTQNGSDNTVNYDVTFTPGTFTIEPARRTIIVTTGADVVDDTDGLTSLREAMAIVYADVEALGEYVITFADDVTTVTVGSLGTNGLVSGVKAGILSGDLDLYINGDTNDDGVADVTITTTADITGAALDFTYLGNYTVNVELSNLIFAGSADGAVRFAAILDAQNAALTVDNVSFIDNEALEDGAAIWSSNVELTVNNSYFKGNEAGIDGGAIALEVSGNQVASISNTTFEGNHAVAVNGGGAVIVTLNDNSALRINNSTFYENTTDALGGGIYIMDYSTGTATITNSTFTKNDAFDGGAIYNAGEGLFTVENTIMVGNGETDLYTDFFQTTRFTYSIATSVGAASTDDDTILTTYSDSYIGDEYTFDAVFGSNTYDTVTHTIAPDAFHLAAYSGRLVYGENGVITKDQLGNDRSNAKNKLGLNMYSMGAVAAKLGITITQGDGAADYKEGGFSQSEVRDLTDRTLTYGGVTVTGAVVNDFILSWNGDENFVLPEIGQYQIDISDLELTLKDGSVLPSAANDSLFEIKYESGTFTVKSLGHITVQDFSETNTYGDALDLMEEKEAIVVNLANGGTKTLYLDVTWETVAAALAGSYSQTGHINAGSHANALVVQSAKAYEKDAEGNYIDVTDFYTWNTSVISTLVVDKRVLDVTVAATDITKVYDGTTDVLPADKTGWLSVNNVAAGETITAAGTWAYRDANAGEDKSIDITGIALSYGEFADSANYSFTPEALATIGDITRKTITIDLGSVTKVYDGSSAHTADLSGSVNGVTVNGITETITYQATNGT
ncbi:MAG: hypothetical protein J6Q65_05300, partial [Lentisphaeria bacterium]|nr:hypothetical protein [Lentisphaeria bacterium]